MSVSMPRSVSEAPNFTRSENSQRVACLKRKLQFSPVAKGIIAGIAAAVALGIIFGPLAALFGFCVGFASAYLSANISPKVIKTTAPSDYSTPEQILRDWDGFLRELEEDQRKLQILAERARVSRKLLHSIIQPGTASSVRIQGSEVPEVDPISDLFKKIDQGREHRAFLRRRARESLEQIL